jgi:hypothetical protein
MNHRQTCVISLGLTIMDHCSECEKLDRAEEETREREERELRIREQESAKREREARIVPSVSCDGGNTWRRVRELESSTECELCARNEHPKGTSFFVGCFDDSRERRHAYLLGPYTTHAEALANVERGRKLASDADPMSHWYSFGTCSISEPTEQKGVFGK